MFSRRMRVEERRKNRKAIVFIFISIALLFILLFLGIPVLANLANFIGNFKNDTTVSILDSDKTPPGPPQIESIPRYIKTPQLTVRGKAEANSMLKAYQNSKLVKTQAIDETTAFTLTLALEKGENTIWFTTQDKASNESDKSTVFLVSFDNEPPTLEINEPPDGAVISGSTNKVKLVGKTEPEARVLINDHLTILAQDGGFSQELTLATGENKITIKSQDPAGNETEKTITLTYSP